MDTGSQCVSQCPLMLANKDGKNGYDVVLLKLDQVIAAQAKTNGDVTALKEWRIFVRGVLWSFGLVLTGMGALIGYYVTYHGGH